MELHQSAYRIHHSTEKTLLKVEAVDQQWVICLLLLVLSATFDTFDHDIWLNQLDLHSGAKETSLNWIQSYLTSRRQWVETGDTGVTSDQVTLNFSVPQGSVLGPILFTLYMVPLGDICQAHHVNFQLYEDDQQVYLSFKSIQDDNTPQEECLKRLQACVENIKSWMNFNLS